MKRFVIFTDGGARGNPGPAATGFVIEDENGNVLLKEGKRIGEATNNVAEYRALAEALKKLKAYLGGKEAKRAHVTVRMDSELIVKQLNGAYKVKEPSLFPFFIDAWNRRQDFAQVTFTHIPRKQNREADRLVNEALDNTQETLV